MSTKIEWTDETWNPVSGCTKVSAACDNCYAVGMANRLQAMGVNGYDGLVERQSNGKLNWTGKVSLNEHQLEKPFKFKKPTRFFVASMGDVFHENVPFDFIDQIFAVMAANPQHTFQVLTKRPERMRAWFEFGSYYR